MAQSAYTQIDLSVLPAPELIETVDYEVIRSRYWDDVVAKNPDLAAARDLEQSPANLILGVQAYGEMLVRLRVNAAAQGVLAAFAKGSDLDHVVTRNGISRAVVIPADSQTGVKAVMESDASLLRRYLLSFDGRAAGTVDRYLLEVYSALPLTHHARVNGWAVHGRRGDVEIVVAGPDGRDLTDDEMARLRAALSDPAVAPESVGISVIRAVRKTFEINLTLQVPNGPDPGVLLQDAGTRLLAAMRSRLQIGSGIPADYVRGTAFSDNTVDVIDRNPIAITPDPYAIPVCTKIFIDHEVV